MNNLSRQQCDKLGDITYWITQGPNPTFVDYVDIPCLTGRNISNGRVTYDNADYVSADVYAEYAKFQLHTNDTLITLKGKGSIGKIGFVTTDKQAIFSRNIGVVRPKTNIDAAYLNAYILSYYGQNMVLRGETGGTGQSTLTCTYIKSLDIPRFSIETQIGGLIRLSESVLTQANECYKKAEQYLCDLLQINKLIFPESNTSIVLASQSFAKTNRLDAEYYQPKYDILKEHLRTNMFGYRKLSEIATTYRGDLISDELYCDNTMRPAYIRGADISSNILLPDKCVYIDDSFIPNKEFKCQLNDIVFAMIGSVGTLARVTEEFVGAFVSNNLGIIRINKGYNICAEYLHILLTSQEIGKLLFEQKEMRTAQPKISDKDIWDFIIPTIPDEEQLVIKEFVDNSFALRNESNRLLELAKTAVEIAIEQGEDKAMELLTQYK